jgi:hypothetical protein
LGVTLFAEELADALEDMVVAGIRLVSGAEPRQLLVVFTPDLADGPRLLFVRFNPLVASRLSRGRNASCRFSSASFQSLSVDGGMTSGPSNPRSASPIASTWLQSQLDSIGPRGWITR